MRRGEIVLLFLLSASGSAQTTVSGTVHDSLGRARLAGATVQLVIRDSIGGVARTTMSDSLGQFNFAAVPQGQYVIGFFHPKLDSLGLEPGLRRIEVRGAVLRVDLALPSATRIKVAVCGQQPRGSGVVMGIVRDARSGAPLRGATVSADWLEIELSAAGAHSSRIGVSDTTSPNGWFALCDVPSPGSVVLAARSNVDSTDRIEETLSADGFLRRDFYVGSSAEGERVQLSGTVSTAEGKQPIAGAQVRIAGRAETRSDERGGWTLADAPAGTRRVEVRAVGYFPEQRAVDVLPGTAPVHVPMFTMAAMLDTIKVRATRTSARMRGFEERRRRGMGRFITAEDIARRRPVVTSDLLRLLAGVYVQRGYGGSTVLMRGCRPAFYIDGMYMPQFTADDLDSFVSPDAVAGIEVYNEPGVPPQFSMPSSSGCGSIVVWTQAPLGPREERAWWKRLGAAAIAVAIIATIGALLR